jgi:hypothetical protein
MIQRSWTKFSVALVLCCALASAAFAGTVSGTVHNGTTNKPGSDVTVILIQLMGGMKPVATTKTDAQGHYQFDNPLLGQGPMLLRAIYRGVMYHEPVTPGTTTVNIDVFEPTNKLSAISVTAHAIIVQPNGPNLNIDEEYNIDNNTNPPVAFYRPGGTFKFPIPAGAQVGQVTAGEANGLPVIQSTTDAGKNEKAIDYAFRPGSSRVGITYSVPYPGNQTQLTFSAPYSVERLAIFAPPTVQISGGNFSPAGSEQGFNAYLRQTVAENTPVTVAISGTAPPPAPDNGDANAADNSQNPSVNSHVDDGAQGSPVATVTTLPARIDSLKWIVVGGFAALFALGLIFVLRQPQVAPATPAGEASAALPLAPPAKPAIKTTQSAAVPTNARPDGPPAAPVGAAQNRPETEAEVEREVRGSLDELKDSLFRLELRREAGTISEEEYIRRRDRVQKTLRELVKG